MCITRYIIAIKIISFNELFLCKNYDDYLFPIPVLAIPSHICFCCYKLWYCNSMD